MIRKFGDDSAFVQTGDGGGSGVYPAANYDDVVASADPAAVADPSATIVTQTAGPQPDPYQHIELDSITAKPALEAIGISVTAWLVTRLLEHWFFNKNK